MDNTFLAFIFFYNIWWAPGLLIIFIKPERASEVNVILYVTFNQLDLFLM